MKMTTVRGRALLATCTAVLMVASATVQAQDVADVASPTPDGKGYTIDYDAIDASQSLTTAQKFQVARALRNGEGHVAAGVESIAGFSGKCDVHKKIGIPVGVDCTLSASPAATKVLSTLGTFALTNAICLVIDVEDGEITEPICDLLLEAVVKATIEPVLDQCADAGKSTTIKVGFDLIPPKIKKPSASCT